MAEVVRHIEVTGPPSDAELEKMLSIPDKEIIMTVSRTAQKGRTFSRDAVDALGTMLNGWVLSRMFRALSDGHPGHTKLTVTIKVEVE
jgi:hypothetical protein